MLSQEPGFQNYSLTLAAGAVYTLPGVGSFLKCFSATAAIEVKLNDGPRNPLKTGRAYRVRPGQHFERLEFYNPNAGSVDIEYGVGFAEVEDDPVLSGAIEISPATGLSTVADVSITAASTVQVLAADTGRKGVLISNLAANTQIMRIGDSNAGAARGIQVAPGQTVTLETTAAVYAYNPGASAEALGVAVLS
jgi:hypothetical protein